MLDLSCWLIRKYVCKALLRYRASVTSLGRVEGSPIN